jgi:hypothetical protein
LTNVPVILHERLGNWSRQLRVRLQGLPVRLFETRSRADLQAVLTGLACPVVLIDAGKHVANGLLDLELVLTRAPDALVVVTNPGSHAEATSLARELGASHVLSGYVPPPYVASLVLRWISLAQRRIARDGWSQTSDPDLNASEDLS